MAILGRGIFTGQISLVRAITTVGYEPLQIIQTGLSMYFFGYNEFAARLPVVVISTIGILFAFLLAKKLSNNAGGLLASFLYAFSQLNLANATQAKPYAAISAILLAVLYLLLVLEDTKKKRLRLILSIILLSFVGFAYHFLGFIVFIPVSVYAMLQYRKAILSKIQSGDRVVKIFAFLIMAGFIGVCLALIDTFLRRGSFSIISYNHITYLRELIWRHYGFIFLPAFIGMILVTAKRKILSIGILLMLAVYLYLWIFKQYTTNIRYLVPFFGLIYVYFGVFWGLVAESLYKRHMWLIALMVALLLFAGGYKIIRKPAAYYTPNADFYGDVQIADYKNFYKELKQKYPDVQKIPIFNNWYDSQAWYMPQSRVEAYFMKPNSWTISGMDGRPIYHSLEEFRSAMKKYPKGILIVEDWESILPEEIKEYAKKNLKLEVRVEGLPQAQGDNWPLAAYSWGLD